LPSWLGCWGKAEDVRDAFSNEHRSLARFPKARGLAQQPAPPFNCCGCADLEVANFVALRTHAIRKLMKNYDAILLACAGLDRLGYHQSA
jgi:hypothetical protein